MPLPVRTPATNNDPIHALERKYGILGNAAFASQSGSAVVPDESTKTYVLAQNLGGKTPAQAAQGLGGGAYASGQVCSRTVS